MLSFEIRFKKLHGAVHRAGAFDHLRQEHLTGFETTPDLLHCAHENCVDHGRCAPGGRYGLGNVAGELRVVSVNQRGRGFGVSEEDRVFDYFEKVGRNIVIGHFG